MAIEDVAKLFEHVLSGEYTKDQLETISGFLNAGIDITLLVA